MRKRKATRIVKVAAIVSVPNGRPSAILTISIGETIAQEPPPVYAFLAAVLS
jgi:hypothetical protein